MLKNSDVVLVSFLLLWQQIKKHVYVKIATSDHSHIFLMNMKWRTVKTESHINDRGGVRCLRGVSVHCRSITPGWTLYLEQVNGVIYSLIQCEKNGSISQTAFIWAKSTILDKIIIGIFETRLLKPLYHQLMCEQFPIVFETEHTQNCVPIQMTDITFCYIYLERTRWRWVHTIRHKVEFLVCYYVYVQ